MEDTDNRNEVNIWSKKKISRVYLSCEKKPKKKKKKQ